ncbi:MAG TPA: hypothetical protein DIC31_10510 [Rhizobiales bacterium]|nr:hypothetical protein [Hyphomicrobiales bacterium]
MSRASYTTDPIEAAEDDIAGSKDLIASVADEINQHQRWLENYRVAEKERARRLKRQELMYQLELRRRRTIRSLRRFSLASLRLARRIASFLLRNGTALVVALGQLLVRGAAWAAPRVRALALTLWRWSVAASAWTWLMARVLARTLVRAAHAFVRGASIGFSWMAAQYRLLDLALGRLLAAGWSWTWRTAVVLARALFKAASLSFSWIAAQSRALDLALGRSLAAGWSWTSRKTLILARAFLRAASISFSWIVLKSKSGGGALRKWALAAFSWIRVEASALARASLKGASITFSWIVLTASVLSGKLSTQAKHGADAFKRSALRTNRSLLARISNGGRRMRAWGIQSPAAPPQEEGGNGLAPELAAPQSEPGPLPNEASAAQHGTAVICVEPLRARLPEVRAS